MRDVNHTGSPPPTRLLAHLRDLIAGNGGFLSFEAYMREALYHPQFGYYTRCIPTVGRTGDFATSATLHPALGKAVAAWATARCAGFSPFARWHLIELGAGGGQLASSVLQNLNWWQRRRVRYHIVESSEPLRREQQTRLAAWTGGRWHGGIESALEEAGGRAVIFSNEFVDAFPCVVLSWAGEGRWQEVGVRWDEYAGEPVETSRLWDASPDTNDATGASIFDPGFVGSLSLGQRVEWHRTYNRWLQGWHKLWTSGAMLTVDYGDVLPALYRRRPAGSVRGYFRHTRCAGAEIYRRSGHQDLTADVNFTDLMRWGAAFGWNDTLCHQADFLRRWLPVKYIRNIRDDPTLGFLLDPEGAGGAFRVLEQSLG